MVILNDCVKEGTLLLEVNGQCMDVSQAFIKYENFMEYAIELIKSIDMKYGRCCEIANNRLNKLEDRVKMVEAQIIRCCKNKQITHVYPVGGTGGIKPIKTITTIFNEVAPKELPYDFRGMILRKQQNKTITINPPKNQNYYSPKEKQAQIDSIRRVNKNYGREFIISSSGKKYYIE